MAAFDVALAAAGWSDAYDRNSGCVYYVRVHPAHLSARTQHIYPARPGPAKILLALRCCSSIGCDHPSLPQLSPDLPLTSGRPNTLWPHCLAHSGTPTAGAPGRTRWKPATTLKTPVLLRIYILFVYYLYIIDWIIWPLFLTTFSPTIGGFWVDLVENGHLM